MNFRVLLTTSVVSQARSGVMMKCCYVIRWCKTLYSTTHYSVSAHADLLRRQRVTVLEVVLVVACVFWSQCVVAAAGVSEWGLLSIMLGCWKGLRWAGPPIQPATAGGSDIPPSPNVLQMAGAELWGRPGSLCAPPERLSESVERSVCIAAVCVC